MKPRSLVFVLFALALGLSVAACGSSPTAPTVSAVAVSGTAPAVGSSSQFVATALNSNGTSQDVSGSATWSSSDSNIATVSSTGLVTALNSGSVTITASYSGAIGTDAIAVP